MPMGMPMTRRTLREITQSQRDDHRTATTEDYVYRAVAATGNPTRWNLPMGTDRRAFLKLLDCRSSLRRLSSKHRSSARNSCE